MKLYNFGLNYLQTNTPSYKIEDPDTGIVTATDSNTFVGVKTLYCSIKDKINFVCYDLGLSSEEIEWCKINGLELRQAPTKIPFIDKWQTYLKPFIVQSSPYKYTIWLDSDCVVTGDLSVSDIIRNKETFFTRHWINSIYLRQNKEDLYKNYPVETKSDLINAGAFAINKTADLDILEHWISMVERTIENEEIRNWVVNWDEGSLLWAIQKTNNNNKIIDVESKYNFFCETDGSSKTFEETYPNFYDRPIGILKASISPTTFFESLLRQPAYICHLSTCMLNSRKYWKRWS